MWSELLPKLVGGTLTDDDAPTEPTEIVGYELTAETVTIKGKKFDVGGSRKYFGITADAKKPGVLRWHGYMINGSIVLPKSEHAA